MNITGLGVSFLSLFSIYTLETGASCPSNVLEAASIIEKVEKHEVCDLHNMDLEEVSLEIMEALKCNKEVKKLNLSNNKLKTLPAEFGTLSELVELDLSCNEMESIPQEIGNLKSLEVLNLSNNKLRSFPWKLLKLGKTGALKNLDLRSNPFYRIFHTALARFFLKLFYGDFVKTGYV
ncbi:hypothetical protein M970_091440 [Encephalitozoon cuniculi EcunIII-L]|uniref:Uncharacterized protein n=1 Tax=Encephalitozoon cuniculi TaxID=6035 RepID=M1K671_ENCCN|nr:hypothetical protein ECU09_1430 [Encephalitozoon cuniculi]KMV65411.1 hypothetical protein M970_091440 [Encephalitozoon cuniculi EcunIII-L]UYI26832.1 leucine-rich repeat domain-containing protein [Encephalitozoon cuniculi]